MKSGKTDYIQIGDRKVGSGYPTYMVAEISANHRQNYENAVSLIKAAKEAGADAVKLQTYTPDTMTIEHSSELFRCSDKSPWAGRSLYELYQEAYMPWEWQPRLKKIADDLDIELFSTPFDKTAVDFLEEMGVPAYKISSFEIVDIPLIEYAVSKRKPIIISTGMATIAEIDEAIRAARESGCTQIALLKCTSSYPALPETMNLRTIPLLLDMFGVPVGVSDHTLGVTVPIAAVSLGACIVEKHFTISRSVATADSVFSLEPNEYKLMVEAIRDVEKALGDSYKGLHNYDTERRLQRRSLFAVTDIRAGEIFTTTNVRSIRPGYGLPPRHIKEIKGRKAKQDIAKGTPLNWDLIL
jgi:pseudaminic acid synthase